ncbi:DUF2809 domain-containing protein [Streptomyces sp. NPDC092296]|uniref:ribosomal maturation YjgA family protein n=1 Tax=Streptomyces sp. NPDC092296 TaxID=3366012 RepID=UPI0038250CD3
MGGLRAGGGGRGVRAAAVGAAVLTVGAGLGVRAATGGGFAKITGDALYTVLVGTLVVLVAPRVRPVVAAGTALAISWAVEFSQLSDVPAELSRRSVAARLVLGSTFDPPDLLWYALGAALCWALHATAERLRYGRQRAG